MNRMRNLRPINYIHRVKNLTGMSLAGGLFVFHSLVGQASELKTVSHVDLDRYMGDWNVIANIPNFIEKDCVSSVESYIRRPDGQIDNEFVCHKKDGSKTKFTALAWVVNHETNAEWKVRFNIDLFSWSIPAPIAFGYWVIDLDAENYTYTVVGHSSRSLLWIMSKNKTIDESVYEGILSRVKEQGFDISKIVKLPQI